MTTSHGRASQITTHPDIPRASRPINDSYCVKVPVSTWRLAGIKETVNYYQNEETVIPCQPLNAYSVVVNHAHSVKGQPQKKGIGIVPQRSFKSVKDVSCVDHLGFVQNFTNVPIAVGARLHQFWETWEALGASPKVIRIFKED